MLFSQFTMRNDNARGLPYLLRFGKHRETESPVRGSSNDILHSPAVSRSPQQTALEGGELEIQILIGLNGFLFHYSPVSGGGRPSGLGNGRACVSSSWQQPHHCWGWPETGPPKKICFNPQFFLQFLLIGFDKGSLQSKYQIYYFDYFNIIITHFKTSPWPLSVYGYGGEDPGSSPSPNGP